MPGDAASVERRASSDDPLFSKPSVAFGDSTALGEPASPVDGRQT
jgi:hypothetical protein